MAAEGYRASVHIAATPDEVFAYFTNPDAIVRWMGRHATLDPRPGGQFSLDFKEARVRGRYLKVERPRRLLISWGHEGSEILPPGSSTLEVIFRAEAAGTTVEIEHRNLPARERPRHATGWQHFLPRLATAGGGGDPGPDPWLSAPPPEVTLPLPE